MWNHPKFFRNTSIENLTTIPANNRRGSGNTSSKKKRPACIENLTTIQANNRRVSGNTSSKKKRPAGKKRSPRSRAPPLAKLRSTSRSVQAPSIVLPSCSDKSDMEPSSFSSEISRPRIPKGNVQVKLLTARKLPTSTQQDNSRNFCAQNHKSLSTKTNKLVESEKSIEPLPYPGFLDISTSLFTKENASVRSNRNCDSRGVASLEDPLKSPVYFQGVARLSNHLDHQVNGQSPLCHEGWLGDTFAMLDGNKTEHEVNGNQTQPDAFPSDKIARKQYLNSKVDDLAISSDTTMSDTTMKTPWENPFEKNKENTATSSSWIDAKERTSFFASSLWSPTECTPDHSRHNYLHFKPDASSPTLENPHCLVPEHSSRSNQMFSPVAVRNPKRTILSDATSRSLQATNRASTTDK